MNLFESLYRRDALNEALEAGLAERGFRETKTAWNNCLALAGQANFQELYPGFFPALLGAVGESFDPDLALCNFERFAEKFFDKDHLYSFLAVSPDLLNALSILFSGSQVLTDSLLRDPSIFDWLAQPATLSQSGSRDVLFRDYFEFAGEKYLTDDTPSLLRRFKKREYVRIGLRDLLGKADARETVEDISNLADVCLQSAYEYADKKLKTKHGVPFHETDGGETQETEFAIFGMGKLGGRELNFSSDIDLIYVYTSSEGETRPTATEKNIASLSNHEYFTKLGQLITKTINDITSEGAVFRVDLDLRPEGPSGEIVNSLAGSEIYYESWGKTWERQALIKARVCAGSEALGAELLSILEPFIYPRHLDFSAVDKAKAMKGRIDQSLKEKKVEAGNIKLGFGGIREIEFIVQMHQLLFGGRDKRLWERHTLDALAVLKEFEFFSQEEFEGLRSAWTFLRNLENRVQIAFGLQTHHLPKDEKSLAALARKMGLTGATRDESVKNLYAEFERHTNFVGAIFSSLFAEESDKQDRAQTFARRGARPLIENEFSPQLLEDIPFEDPDRAFRFLKSLRDGPDISRSTEKSLQNFYSVVPALLRHCAGTPKPNSAVENFVKFMEASRARDSFLDLFKNNDKFLELMIALFGSSDYLSQLLIRRPNLMDAALDPESIYRFKAQNKIVEDLNQNLGSQTGFDAKNIFLRKFKQGEELRIGLRYLVQEVDLPGTLADLSQLADVYMQAALDLASAQMSGQASSGKFPAENFAVVGLGKLGGRELNFDSDLDVVFVYDEDEGVGDSATPPEEWVSHYAALAQWIYKATSETTSVGFAYKIDTELRPEGNQGLIIHSIRRYGEYFKTRARIWERQALTRARFVAGDPAVGEKFIRTAQEFVYGEKLDRESLIEISRLRERMEKELALEFKKGKNVKLGFGGLADIEFSVQILQLMHGVRHPRLRQTNTFEALQALGEGGILDQGDVEKLRQHYLFLRNLECALRIIGQAPTNYLPKDDVATGQLGRLMRLETGGGNPAQILRERYQQSTEEVRALFRKTVGALLRSAM